MEGSDLTEGSIEAFDQLLSKHNIHVAIEVPSEIPVLPALNVKYKVFTTEDFEMNNRNKRQDIIMIDHKGFSATFIPPIPVTSTEDAKEKVKGEVFFIEEYAQLPSESNSKTYVYVQQKNGYPLFDAKINVSLNQNHIVLYSQSYYEVVSESAEGKKVISGITALRTLVESSHLQKYETITDMKLGYYGQQFSSEQQVLTPVWRIKVQSGEVYEVNAFTGTIDKATALENQ